MLLTRYSDEIEDAVDLLRQVAGPKVAREHEGASDEDIEKLIQVARFPLPALYISYLRKFGTNAGQLRLGLGKTDLKPLLKYYSEIVPRLPGGVVHDGVVLTGISDVEGPMMLRYSEAPQRAGQEPDVVVAGDIYRLLATSFRCKLYQSIMHLRPQNLPITMRLERFPDEDTFDRERATNMTEVVRAVRDLEFEGYWFNDTCVGWFEREDGSVLYVDTLDYSVFVRGHFDTIDTRDFVQEYLTECVGLLPAK